ncbi:MAG: hypothetical protein RLZZ502_393, partial [Pseudomonadota bacterium]
MHPSPYAIDWLKLSYLKLPLA